MLSLFTPMPYNQVRPPLMRSLLDQMSEPKETQVCSSIQPHSAGPAELSIPDPVVEVSCMLMSSLVFTLCGTLLQLWHCWVNMTDAVTAKNSHVNSTFNSLTLVKMNTIH